MTTSDLTLVLATESFLTGAQFSNDTSTNRGLLTRLGILSLQQQANRGELTNFTTTACLEELTGVFSTRFSAALLITNATSPATTSVLQTSSSSRSPGTALPRDRNSLKYCLARPSPPPTCSLLLNAPLLGAVAVLHLLALLTTVVLLLLRFSPDDTTTTRQPGTPSLRRWVVTLLLWLTPASLAAVALAHSLLSEPSARLSPFGIPSPHGLLRLPASTPPAAAALVASTPHLLLFALYLAVDGVLARYRQGKGISRLAWWVVAVVFVGLEFLLGQGFFSVGMEMGGEYRGEFMAVRGTGMLGVLAGLVGLGLGGGGLVVMTGVGREVGRGQGRGRWYS